MLGGDEKTGGEYTSPVPLSRPSYLALFSGNGDMEGLSQREAFHIIGNSLAWIGERIDSPVRTEAWNMTSSVELSQKRGKVGHCMRFHRSGRHVRSGCTWMRWQTGVCDPTSPFRFPRRSVGGERNDRLLESYNKTVERNGQ